MTTDTSTTAPCSHYESWTTEAIILGPDGSAAGTFVRCSDDSCGWSGSVSQADSIGAWEARRAAAVAEDEEAPRP